MKSKDQWMSGDGYRYPFSPFPNGWFPIEISRKLAPGQHVSKHVLGQDLVIYRTESGVAIGAYCPHMGAHIGHGGCVVGEPGPRTFWPDCSKLAGGNA